MAYPGTFVTGQVLTAAEMNAINEGASARPLLTGGAYIDGTNGLVLSGLTGNGATTPDSAALDITGDIEVTFRASSTDWVVGTGQFVVQKGSPAAYQLNLLNGAIYFTLSTGGVSYPNQAIANVAASGSFVDGTTYWIRFTRVASTGVCTVEWAADSATEPTVWNNVSVSGTQTAGNLDTNSGALAIGGATGFLGNMWAGTFYRVIIRDGIGGTVALDADFEAEAADTLAFTEDSANAATVAVTTTRYTVGIPNWSMSSATTQSHSLNTSFFSMFQITRAIDVDMLAMEVTTGPASAATVKAGIWALDDNMNLTGSVLVDFGSFTVGTSATGAFYKQTTPVTLPPGQYVLVTNSSVTLTVRGFRGSPTFCQLAMGAAPFQFLHRNTTTNSTFPGSQTTWTVTSVTSSPAYSTGLIRWKAS